LPDILRLGPSGMGVNLLDTAHYLTSRLKQKAKRTRIVQELVGDDNVVLSRENFNNRDRSYDVSCIASGYQAKLTDYAAIETQLEAARAYSQAETVVPIYLQEQFSNQTTRADHLVIVGDFDEEERPDFVTSHKTGILHLVILRAA
jgi:hypothetical protein